MAETNSMEQILKPEPAQKEIPLDAPKDEVQVEAPAVERAESAHKKHMRAEYAAQGRDPETGQFAKKDETKEEEKKAEAPAEKH